MRNFVGALSLVVLATFGFAAPSQAEGTLFPLPTAPEGDLAGVNDWSCRPTAQRPTPVILLHGTIGDRRHLLERLSTSIMDAGFCVFSLDYGNRGIGEISRSAQQLRAFVDRVRRSTGAKKVSIVGHSQGGMMPRYYIKFLGGARYVDDLVGIAPANHGTSVSSGLNMVSALVGQLCVACVQLAANSAFLKRLNAGDETPGDVSYTQITTLYDLVVMPYTSGFLKAGPRTTNVTIQGLCPSEMTEHLLMPQSRTAVAITLDALTRKGPALISSKLGC